MKSETFAAQHILPYLVVVLAVLFAYSNAYDNAFLFDDDLLITHNDFLSGWSNFGKLFTSSTTEGAHIAGGFYRPVQLVLYFLINQAAGLSTFAFHALNIALHAANGCLMLALGRRLKFNPVAVFCATIIWAVHPLHTEAVTYMSATADVLFGFFCLLGCVVILPEATPRRVIAVIPIFLLALLSKETSVIFPALAVLCLLAVRAPTDNWLPHIRKILVATSPLWVMAGLYMFWRLGDDSFDGPRRYQHLYALKDFANLKMYADHFEDRLYTFLATLPAYLGLLVWPVGLHMERAFPIYTDPTAPQIWEGLAIICAAIGQIVWGRGKRGIAMSWGILWAAAAHFPNCGLVVPTNALFLEHWMYVPSIGLLLGTVESLSAFIQKGKHAFVSLSLCLAALLGFLTFQQNLVWHDPVSFYTHLFKYGVVSARAHNNLALAYAERNRIPEALNEFRKAMAITDTYAETRHNYAITLLHQPDPDSHIQEAIDNLNRAVEIDPNFYRSLEALAAIYGQLGDMEKAQEFWRRAELAKARFNPM